MEAGEVNNYAGIQSSPTAASGCTKFLTFSRSDQARFGSDTVFEWEKFDSLWTR